jgi:hypothetical protein
MSWGPDPDGVNGVYLGKNVVSCAADALQRCLRQITPRVGHTAWLAAVAAVGAGLCADVECYAMAVMAMTWQYFHKLRNMWALGRPATC